MNIIEAIQAAENGSLITNNFMKPGGRFYKYMGAGLFYEYEVINGKARWWYDVRNFTMAEILSIAWEVLPADYCKFKGSDQE